MHSLFQTNESEGGRQGSKAHEGRLKKTEKHNNKLFKKIFLDIVTLRSCSDSYYNDLSLFGFYFSLSLTMDPC